LKKTAIIYLLIAVVTAVMYILNLLSPGRLSPMLDLGFIIITLAGLVIIYLAGTLRRSRFNIFVLAGISITIIGAVFKIQHWPMAELIFFSGLGVTAILYFIHFILKPVKQLLDYLKVIWLLLRIAAIFFVFNNLPYGDLLTHITSIVLLAVIFLYLYQDHDKEILAKRR